MKKRAIILYWILLLVPTVIIGVLAFGMLGHERERIENRFKASAEDRADIVAENIRLSVIAVQESMVRSLLQIPNDKRTEALLQWERENPLVRNGYVWEPKNGLIFPDPKGPSTTETRLFLSRYETFFSGREPWPTTGVEPDATSAQAAGPGPAVKSRRVLREPAKSTYSTYSGVTKPIPGVAPKKDGPLTGWIPWYSGNRLHLLSWVRRTPDSAVYGVEIEMMFMLSRLIDRMPETVPEGIVYGLVDGSGRLFHQSGASVLRDDSKPDIRISLEPELPHWQVVVYFVDGGASATGKSVVLFGGLMLAIFLAAIILGGSLLLWQAHRNMRDALQKTSFVSNVSHELKTPLTSIRMFAELLSEGRVKDPDRKRQYLEGIVSESHRLTRLVNNVLDFSRLEQGRKKYAPERTDVAAWLGEAVEMHRLRIEDAGLKVSLLVPDYPCIARTDRDVLEQVFLNLIDNAAKYASEGDGELVIALRRTSEGLRIDFKGPGAGSACGAQGTHLRKVPPGGRLPDDGAAGSGIGAQHLKAAASGPGRGYFLRTAGRRGKRFRRDLYDR